MTLFLRTIYTWQLCFLPALFFCALPVTAQPKNTKSGSVPVSGEFAFKPATPAFTPTGFYVAEIVDERADKSSVGLVVSASSKGAQATDLKGGGYEAIKRLVQESVPRNSNLRPVVVRLKECSVKEKSAGAGRVEGQATVAMAFELKRTEQNVPLVEYRGGARYNRPVTQSEVVAPALQQSLIAALRFLNSWVGQEAGHNPKLAMGLQVNFKDYAVQADDSVFYGSRPLTWDDFKAATPAKSHYAAAVFPSFSYEGKTEVKDGIIYLNLALKVYVLQHSSWVRSDAKNAKNAYALNHEQRHFDIARLVAARFKQKITPENLSLDDYDSNIQFQFIESFREMNQLQEQYDNETQHGKNEAAQAHWNTRIDEELKKISEAP